jgi:hypothetical protein
VRCWSIFTNGHWWHWLYGLFHRNCVLIVLLSIEYPIPNIFIYIYIDSIWFHDSFEWFIFLPTSSQWMSIWTPTEPQLISSPGQDIQTTCWPLG